MTDEAIRVQIDPRKDGRYTTTVKLVAYDLNRLRAVAGGLRVLPVGRQIGEAVLVELEDVLIGLEAEARQLAAEEPTVADEALGTAGDLEEALYEVKAEIAKPLADVESEEE